MAELPHQTYNFFIVLSTLNCNGTLAYCMNTILRAQELCKIIKLANYSKIVFSNI